MNRVSPASLRIVASYAALGALQKTIPPTVSTRVQRDVRFMLDRLATRVSGQIYNSLEARRE